MHRMMRDTVDGQKFEITVPISTDEAGQRDTQVVVYLYKRVHPLPKRHVA